MTLKEIIKYQESCLHHHFGKCFSLSSIANTKKNEINFVFNISVKPSLYFCQIFENYEHLASFIHELYKLHFSSSKLVLSASIEGELTRPFTWKILSRLNFERMFDKTTRLKVWQIMVHQLSESERWSVYYNIDVIVFPKIMDDFGRLFKLTIHFVSLFFLLGKS